METFLYLIPISVILGLIGLVVFLWTLRNGQYDDLDGSAERIIYDEDRPKVDDVGQAEAEAGAEAQTVPHARPHTLTSPGEDPGPTDDATRAARPMGPGSAAGEDRGGEEHRRGEKDRGDGKAPAGDKAPAPTPTKAPTPGHTP
ncbi:cbb3-type cytochrome oxidase assembly protein CcoS [Devosia sp. D6-9]|nr:cbb3-type cytochrome oxidase assembly protein CcoS [Devosia sp. D6-9]